MSKSESSFLEEIEALTDKLRRDIDAKSLGLDSSKSAIEYRRRKVLVDADYEFFARTYFPHHVWGDFSVFQKDFCKRFPKILRMPTGVSEWWVAPRGESKSTLQSKIGPVFINIQCLLEQDKILEELKWQGPKIPFNDYVLLLSAELRLPVKMLAVVKTELEFNSALIMDFPEACGRSAFWKMEEIVTKTNLRIEPRGATQAVRGTFHGASRPKVLLGDDLITDDEAKSKEHRENRWNWVTKSIEYLGPPDGSVKFLSAGTILNIDDPISRAKKTIGHTVHHYKAVIRFPERDDLWAKCQEIMRNEDERAKEKAGEPLPDEKLPSYKFYLKHKKQMDKGAITSWPSVRSLYKLMQKRAANKKAFGTEMQGEARNDDDRVFTDMRYWVQVLKHWEYFGACDPSMGKGEKSDPSAIIVGAWDRVSHKLNVVEAIRKRRVASKLQADLIAAQREYGCTAWAFENNNAYEHMRTDFIDRALEQGVSLPLRPVTATVPPEVRIDSLEPFINGINPKILIHPQLIQLVEELDNWPDVQPHHHYDLLVALHLLWMITSSRAGRLPNVVTRQSKDSIDTTGYQ